MKKLTLLALAAVLALTACGNTPTHDAHMPQAPHDEPRVVDVVLSEFSITPFDVEEGETVTFNVTNEGAVEHEFRFTAPSDSHDHDADHEMPMGDVLALDPGESGSITVTFDKEYTQAACLLPGHYEAGMFTDITDTDHEGDHS